jgi:hypothetical protein
MFKGEPGTRKSTAALSYPTPQYWVSTDQKMESLILPGKRWGVDFTQVDFDDYSDWDKPRDRLEKLQVNCKYKTIIVDSITSIGDAMTRQVRKNKRANNDGKLIGNISVSGLEEYNAESAAFQELTAILKDIHKFHGVNVILIAHVVGQRKNDDANKLTHHSRVIITGGDKIAGKLASYMTEAYHFNIEADFNIDSGEGKYGLYTSHTGNDYARTSLPIDRKIMFNDQPLYEKWIKPGILRLEAEKPIQRIPDQPPSIPSVQPTTQPSTTGFSTK